MKHLVSFLTLIVSVLTASATTLNFGNPGWTGNKDASGNPVYPYYGNIDGGSTINLLCIDFNHDVSSGDSFAVNVSTISDLSKTRFGSVSGATSLYEQIFYLASYLPTAGTADIGNLQDAIWSIFAANAPTQSAAGATRTIQQWLTLAANNYQGRDYSSYRVATDALNQTSGKQELFYTVAATIPGLNIATPEPSPLLLLTSGFALLLLPRARRVPAMKLLRFAAHQKQSFGRKIVIR